MRRRGSDSNLGLGPGRDEQVILRVARIHDPLREHPSRGARQSYTVAPPHLLRCSVGQSYTSHCRPPSTHPPVHKASVILQHFEQGRHQLRVRHARLNRPRLDASCCTAGAVSQSNPYDSSKCSRLSSTSTVPGAGWWTLHHTPNDTLQTTPRSAPTTIV